MTAEQPDPIKEDSVSDPEKTPLEHDLGLPIPEHLTEIERALLNRVRDLEAAQHRSPWTGRVAFILAIGVAVTLVALAAPALIPHDNVSSEEATTLATVIGAAIGGLTTYLGLRDRH